MTYLRGAVCGIDNIYAGASLQRGGKAYRQGSGKVYSKG